jgi:hypothetical protein
MNIDDVTEKVERLKFHVGALYGAINWGFPDGYIRDHQYGGIDSHSHEYPLKPIASGIDDVMACFDALQEAIGLQKGDEPRHRAFLTWKLSRPED